MSDDLERSLGLLDVISISMGSMIGSGIFILPGVAFLEVGTPSVVLAFLISGVLTIPTALSAAEMSTAMPESGGSYLYIQKGMGPLLGTIAGIGNWLVLNFKTALALIGGIPYLIFIFPIVDEINLLGFEPIVILSVFLTVLFTFINAFSADSASKAQNVIVGFMMLSLMFLLIGSTPEAISNSNNSIFDLGNGISFISTIALVFISYAGVIKVTSVAEEIKNPGKNIPRGIIISLLITTLIYVAITFVTVFTLDIAELAQEVPIGDGGISSDGEGAIIALVAQETIGRIGAIIVVVSALLALASTANSGILSASRYPYAMAKDNLAPSKLNEINEKFGTPLYSILATGGIVVIMVLFFPIDSVARFGGAFQVIVFILVNLSLIGFREVDVEYYSPEYFAPLYPYLQIIGILTGVALLTQMGIIAFIGSVTIVAVSVAYFYLYVQNNITSESAVKEELRDEKRKEVFRDISTLYNNLEKFDILVVLREDEVDTDVRSKLINISEQLTYEDINTTIHVVNFTGSPRKTLSESHPNITNNQPNWVEEYSNLEFRTVGSQSPNKSIVEYATYHDIDLIIQNYRDSDSSIRSINKDTKWVIENAPCESIVLNDGDIDTVEKVSIVTQNLYFSPTKLLVADSISRSNNAILEITHIVNKNASDAKLDTVREYQDQIKSIVKSTSNMRIIKSNDPINEFKNLSSDSDYSIINLDISTIRKRVFYNSSIEKMNMINHPSLLVYSEYNLQYNTIYKRMIVKYVFRGLN